MKQQKRSYSTTFKQKAVELSYARGNVKQVCEELDIPYSVLQLVKVRTVKALVNKSKISIRNSMYI